MTLTESLQRFAVAKEAESWLQTPYHHAASVKGVGVDCAYLLLKVYEAVGLAPPYDIGTYKAGLALYLKGERLYRQVLSRLAIPVDRKPLPGDIQVFKVVVGYRRKSIVATHGGIITDWPRFIHADSSQHRVTEGDLTRLHPHLRLSQLWTMKAWAV